jgi:tetratricopeptide (TPR) repeat protein
MRSFLHFLSGEVPGGVLLLFFIVLVINLSLFYLYNSSKLFTREVYKRKAIRSNIFVFSIYLVLWIFLEPPKLPERVLILPFQNNQKVDYRLSESIQQQLYGNLEKDYILHRWEWFYSTANKDSIHLESYRISLARNIDGAFILFGDVEEGEGEIKVGLRVNDGDNQNQALLSAANFGEVSLKIVDWIRKNLPILNKNDTTKGLMSDDYLSEICLVKTDLLEGNSDSVVERYETPDSNQVSLVASAYLQKGILEMENHSGSPLDGLEMNLYFTRLFNLIIPYSKEGKDTADLNIILARMYMHHGNYGMAEVCLKKAVTQERYNPRIYYSMSFLHDSRYEEMGFSNRTDILKLAVQLDPGYKNAVYELADELYITGTAAPTNPNTINSIKVLRDYLNINSSDENILTLLGRILLQSKYTLEAQEIYRKLLSMDPQSAVNHYNLGICYFHKVAYDSAKIEFNRAIDISDYPDAYLYLGAMYRLEGDPDRALHYYRERIKRKQGDDDQYAKEAMRGIRLILNDLAEEEEKANADGKSQ